MNCKNFVFVQVLVFVSLETSCLSQKAKSSSSFLRIKPIERFVGGLSTRVNNLDPRYRPAAFSVAYVSSELLSIPPAPLAMTAGMLFGLVRGTLLVLISGLVSASIAFIVGRKFQTVIQSWFAASPMFTKIDTAIYNGGFKAILILRLIPTPLPGINYLYGITTVHFVPYLIGTLVGYFPGTIAIVYSGLAGKQILEGNKPWWVYATGVLGVLLFLNFAAGVAQTAFDDLV